LGLDGVKDIQMHLERDEFEITYDASKVSVEQLIAATKTAGYTSRVVAASDTADTSSSDQAVPKGFAVLDQALDKARKGRKPVVLVFSAEWCVPCKTFARGTLADERVVMLLNRCVFLKIDTDKEPELAKQFEVVGVPDIRFLNAEGTAVKRFGQRLDPELFVAELEMLLKAVEPK
jgi:thiol:disulfide interchange protein DsbD